MCRSYSFGRVNVLLADLRRALIDLLLIALKGPLDFESWRGLAVNHLLILFDHVLFLQCNWIISHSLLLSVQLRIQVPYVSICWLCIDAVVFGDCNVMSNGFYGLFWWPGILVMFCGKRAPLLLAHRYSKYGIDSIFRLVCLPRSDLSHRLVLRLSIGPCSLWDSFNQQFGEKIAGFLLLFQQTELRWLAIFLFESLLRGKNLGRGGKCLDAVCAVWEFHFWI